MNELAARNMALLCDALDREEYRYFCSSERLISYMACASRIRSTELRPNVLRLTATPQDTGILFEASLPVAIKPETDEDLDNLLLGIARENYGTIRGALAYRPSSGHLYYRLFYALTGSASEFSAKEAYSCLRLCAASLSDSYPSILRAMNSRKLREHAEEDDASAGEVDTSFDVLFESLFSHSKNDVAEDADDAEEDSDAAEEDSDAPALPDDAFPDDLDDDAPEEDEESSPLDEELLSILDDILESDETPD